MSVAIPDVHGYLTADETVQSIVGHGSPIVYGVYPLTLREACPLPALTYIPMLAPDVYSLDPENIGLHWMRLQIDCWAMSWAEMDALGWAVHRLFDGVSGYMGSVPVSISTFAGSHDTYFSDRRQFNRTMEFELVFRDVPDGNGAPGGRPMAPVPTPGAIQQITFSGSVDGRNRVFTLPFAPSLLLIFVNGMILGEGPGNDFVLAGDQVTFAVAPAGGAIITGFAY